jgi:hypothetical protein
LFGGGDLFLVKNCTWEYDGNTWAQTKPATLPPKLGGAAMAYDVAMGKIVMFGGFPDSNETWEYGDYGFWVRPLSMFLESVEVDGEQVPRFALVQAEHGLLKGQ